MPNNTSLELDVLNNSSASPLNVSEIDRLLGFEKESVTDNKSKNIREILKIVSYERLPMLVVIMEMFSKILKTNLSEFFAQPVTVSMESITSLRFGDYRNLIQLPTIIQKFKSPELNSKGFICIDNS